MLHAGPVDVSHALSVLVDAEFSSPQKDVCKVLWGSCFTASTCEHALLRDSQKRRIPVGCMPGLRLRGIYG